jgi:phenylpropionate dioxygenase-like ring-hydroxylating dioxygenase large terminal subunit
MLVTQQPLLRKFWYPVIPEMMLKEGPRAFTLLGRELVLWIDGKGEAVAMDDRCPHRHAKLSKGWIDQGQLLCGYHGWTFNGEGRCTRIPQKGDDDPGSIGVPRYRTASRCGYVWVALEEPIAELPEFTEDSDPGYRRIYEFYEPWKCSGLRLMENSFDNAHFSFVHRATFGKIDQPEPSKMNLYPFANGFGFTMDTEVPVKNVALSKKSLNMTSEETVRHNTGIWWMPFCRKLRMRYPTGLVHTIITAATPIDDYTSQIIQIAYRNDTEQDAKAADIIAFDRAVVTEDRAVLESTTFDTPVDLRRREEMHMASDAPGLLMRRQLMAKFKEFGQEEAHGWTRGAGSDTAGGSGLGGGGGPAHAGQIGANLPFATETLCLEMTYSGAGAPARPTRAGATA